MPRRLKCPKTVQRAKEMPERQDLNQEQCPKVENEAQGRKRKKIAQRQKPNNPMGVIWN